MTIADDTRAVRETSLGWMIQRIARSLDDQMSARLGELGLTLPSFAVMMAVLEHGPLSQSAIGKHFALPAYTISRALDTLEEAGLVERSADAASRRANSICATAKGRALAPELHAIVAAVNDELCAPLTVDERAAFSGLLAKVLPQG